MRNEWVRVLAAGLLFAAASPNVDAQNATFGAAGRNRAGEAVETLLPNCSVADGGAAARSAQADDSKKNGFDLANLDRSVPPCEDFYHFANGGWIKNNPIPAAYPRWGSFTILQEHNQDVLHTIVEEAAKDKTAQPGSNWQKIGDFYASCMDESDIYEEGFFGIECEFYCISLL
jgi:putative endopeptidase